MVLLGRLSAVLNQLSGSMEQGWLYIGAVISLTCSPLHLNSFGFKEWPLEWFVPYSTTQSQPDK